VGQLLVELFEGLLLDQKFFDFLSFVLVKPVHEPFVSYVLLSFQLLFKLFVFGLGILLFADKLLFFPI
jgi:hypothetical protein